jgi:hypothetical protein
MNCRHKIGLRGRAISSSQGLYLHTTTQHKDTREKHPCHKQDSNRDPVYKRSRFVPQTPRPLDQHSIPSNRVYFLEKFFEPESSLLTLRAALVTLMGRTVTTDVYDETKLSGLSCFYTLGNLPPVQASKCPYSTHLRVKTHMAHLQNSHNHFHWQAIPS